MKLTFRTCSSKVVRVREKFTHPPARWISSLARLLVPIVCYDEGVKKHRKFPWIPILAVGFVIAFLGNLLFTINAYGRSRVVAVPDGDSLDLADGRRIRLLGIDSPEKGRCMADEARDKLVELAQGRHVRLKETVRDDFGRQLATVIVRDSVLQRELLSVGLARNRSSTGNPYYQVLKDAVEVAKAAKLGIWSDVCRGQTSGNEDCTIKGNIREGKKTFYTPDCSYYHDVIVDTAFGDAWFCTEADAGKAGFTKAASCRQ